MGRLALEPRTHGLKWTATPRRAHCLHQRPRAGADLLAGRRRAVVNAFAVVLCCSRHLFVRPVVKMDQRAWTECHAAAFEFFGGFRRG